MQLFLLLIMHFIVHCNSVSIPHTSFFFISVFYLYLNDTLSSLNFPLMNNKLQQQFCNPQYNIGMTVYYDKNGNTDLRYIQTETYQTTTDNWKISVHIFITVKDICNNRNTEQISIHIPVIQNCGLFHVPVLAVKPSEGHDYCSSQMWWYQCSDCAWWTGTYHPLFQCRVYTSHICLPRLLKPITREHTTENSSIKMNNKIALTGKMSKESNT
jgi:hypothetical protein